LSVTNKRDVHGSVHHDIITKITNKLQIRRLIYYSLSVLHVSGDIFAHHQKHLTVFTASGTIHQYRCRLVSWMSSVGLLANRTYLSTKYSIPTSIRSSCNM